MSIIHPVKITLSQTKLIVYHHLVLSIAVHAAHSSSAASRNTVHFTGGVIEIHFNLLHLNRPLRLQRYQSLPGGCGPPWRAGSCAKSYAHSSWLLVLPGCIWKVVGVFPAQPDQISISYVTHNLTRHHNKDLVTKETAVNTLNGWISKWDSLCDAMSDCGDGCHCLIYETPPRSDGHPKSKELWACSLSMWYMCE